jgi:hypothetical protein
MSPLLRVTGTVVLLKLGFGFSTGIAACGGSGGWKGGIGGVAAAGAT